MFLPEVLFYNTWNNFKQLDTRELLRQNNPIQILNIPSLILLELYKDISHIPQFILPLSFYLLHQILLISIYLFLLPNLNHLIPHYLYNRVKYFIILNLYKHNSLCVSIQEQELAKLLIFWLYFLVFLAIKTKVQEFFTNNHIDFHYKEV